MAPGQGGDDGCLAGVCCEMCYLSPHKVLALVSTQSDERLHVASRGQRMRTRLPAGGCQPQFSQPSSCEHASTVMACSEDSVKQDIS